MMKISKKRETELEKYFSKIQASFTKKFLVTFCDMLYVIIFNLPVFIFAVYWKPSNTESFSVTFSKAFQTAYRNLIMTPEASQAATVEAWRCLCFSLWIFFFCYIYFVFVPSFVGYQTLFSSNFGIKAITLRDSVNHKGKIKQRQLFRANFVPVFLLPILNIIFFSVTSGTNLTNWVDLFKKGNSDNEIFKTVFRTLVVITLFLQIHHLFSVSASKKALNWFVKSNGIIYVDIRKAEIVMMNEDKPILDKKSFYLEMPGVEPIVYESINKEVEETEKSDFSDQINVN